ncbi:phosphoenolpyruvate--protein phosphotransferase [Shewanella psychrotolerans]|uniref:phosphoenolpyruvate--protein phosphotransferase n=1 Tax=Shewanella psychrotolerans TaxID=2864206 RepID=UPI001C661DA5|nr:phosphoenolpyruvate--protein phosphotransferase [Shewanella psychrotolerans]QYK00722.1 phosphoenolpyruvate--protein phosphotransferase [Shewanella psychrotolerans]
MNNNTSTMIQLLSPFKGISCPLNQVPDAAFAQKLVGDGFAIDPTANILHAPCDAKVTQIHPSQHAVTLTTDDGVEILLHIGVDTVKLKGDGFKALVSVGEHVEAKAPLIEVDLDKVACSVKSLRTVVLLTDQERIIRLTPTTDKRLNVGDLLFSAELGQVAEAVVKSDDMISSPAIKVINPTGIHARPAAAIVAAVKPFNCDVMLEKAGEQANARSVVGLMGLDIGFGDDVVILAKGADQQAAIEALSAAIASGLGEEGVDEKVGEDPANAFDPFSEPSLLLETSSDPRKLLGVEASPGQVRGRLFVIKAELPKFETFATDPIAEQQTLDQAIKVADATLIELVEDLRAKQMGQKADIFVAHQELLADPELYEKCLIELKQGKSAPYAWDKSVCRQADKLAAMNNPLLAGRAADLVDVGNRVSRILAGLSQDTIPDSLPENTIIVAKDLVPSETAKLDPAVVLGICTTLGGASSHSAILARAMGIAAMAGVEAKVMELHGAEVLLDTAKGYLLLEPTDSEMAELSRQQAANERLKALAFADKDNAAVTTDGVQVEVAGNIAKVAEAEKLVAMGGEAVGLLRSEFLYQDQSAAPSEEDQEQAYRTVLTTLGERPLVVRTLDVGGDKPLSYLPLPKEDNPFLGERGIRVGLDKPAVLRQQIRALLKAADAGRLRIMFPMVASLFELKLAKQVLKEEALKLSIDISGIEVGIMIEVPSAAVMADLLAEHVDFFSIGTNDLTQYTLAIDRGHPKLAAIADGLHPAVLRLIDITAKAAHAKGKWVGVCGGLAGEKDAVPILVGLGIDELSVSVPSIPEVKYQVRSLNQQACLKVAADAMACADAKAVRELMHAPNTLIAVTGGVASA